MFDFILTEEQRRLRDEAREFSRWVPKELILAMDREEIHFPKEYLKEAGKRNLLGIRIPKELGGRGLGWVENVIVAEEVGVPSYSLACLWGVGADIVCDAIAEFGCDELKEEVVKPLLKGEVFAAEGLTEPRGGSDFFGAKTYAVKDGSDWIINGSKRFIVGAEGADWFLVYAVTDRDNPDPHRRITAFMVPRTKGVETEYIYGLMGVRGGGAGRLRLNNVRVPERYALNGINGGYEVFKRMMIPERLGTAAMTIGSVRPAIEIATKYTSRRKAFGKEIAKFQAVGFKVADSVMLLDAARGLVYSTAPLVTEAMLIDLFNKKPITATISTLLDLAENENDLLRSTQYFVNQIFLFQAYIKLHGQVDSSAILGYKLPKAIEEQKAQLALRITSASLLKIFEHLLQS